MNNKKVFAILLIVAAVLMIGAGALIAAILLQPEDIILNNTVIVLPADATEVEKTAASELNTYFGKITGTELSVVTEGETAVTAGIYIGTTQFAAANKVTYPEAKFNEGWAIKAVNGNLVVIGGRERGVLYGVYHLLEDEFGVRWWTYWEEYVPSTPVLTIAGNFKNSGKPALVWRDMHGGRTSIGETNLFCVRNRLNGDTANAPMTHGGEEAFGLLAHVHTFNRYFDINDFRTNPEWFAYVNGGRISTGQLCLTNEGLIEEMAKRVMVSIERSYAAADAAGEKRPQLYDISPNDQEEHCSCENCTKARNEKGPSGLLIDFINKVAAKVAPVYPDAYIETLAYATYIDIPLDGTKPADNVVIRLAISGRDALHGLNHEYNEKTVQQIKDWVSITKEGQLYLWDYNVFYNNPGVAPMVMDYAENYQLLNELGIDGYFGEQENPIMADFWDMQFWMNAKLMENPNLDEETLLNDFLNGYYGAAAPYIREYLDMMNKKANATLVRMGFSAGTINAKWLGAEEMVKGQELIEKALKAVGNNPDLQRRVRQVRNALDRMLLERYDYFVEQATAKGLTIAYSELEVCQRIVDVLEEQIAFRGAYDYDAEHYLDVYKSRLNKLLD
jgi:hypothetical protein